MKKVQPESKWIEHQKDNIRPTILQKIGIFLNMQPKKKKGRKKKHVKTII